MTSTILNGKCDGCGHMFIVAHLPMPLEKAAELMKRAACPKCGETKRIFCAPDAPVEKSNNGDKST